MIMDLSHADNHAEYVRNKPYAPYGKAEFVKAFYKAFLIFHKNNRCPNCMNYH